jgi:hypothetical protein
MQHQFFAAALTVGFLALTSPGVRGAAVMRPRRLQYAGSSRLPTRWRRAGRPCQTSLRQSRSPTIQRCVFPKVGELTRSVQDFAGSTGRWINRPYYLRSALI